MGKSKFTDEQIADAMRQAEQGTPVPDVCQQLGVREATFYRWKRQFGGMGVNELRVLRQLRDENRKLRQVVADLTQDNIILQKSLRKKW